MCQSLIGTKIKPVEHDEDFAPKPASENRPLNGTFPKHDSPRKQQTLANGFGNRRAYWANVVS
jgi:hypothetical protein